MSPKVQDIHTTGPGDNGIHQDSVGGADAIASNYQYWRQHGHEWADEYDKRKLEQPYYHIQELMIAEYVRNHAPARVLEFGCGVGRHLRNLSRVEGVEIHGYDQSAGMVSQISRWATPEWVHERVRVGLPTGRLPYEDGAFDLVYSSEVLMHVRPADLPGILRELVRVSRGQVFHMEPTPGYVLVDAEHDGCWSHDLCAEYKRLGRSCERMASGFAAQSPYRVVLDPGAVRYDFPTVLLEVLGRMERDLKHGFDVFRGDVAGWKEREGAASRQAWSLERALRDNTAELDRVLAVAEGVAAERDRLGAETERLRVEIERLGTETGRLGAELAGAQAAAERSREGARALERRAAEAARERDAQAEARARLAARQSAFVRRAKDHLG